MQYAELKQAKGTDVPDDSTYGEWQRICSTWESAHADKKAPYIGTTLHEGKPEQRRREASRNWDAFNRGMDLAHPGWSESAESRYLDWKPGSDGESNDLVNDEGNNMNFVLDEAKREGERLWDSVQQRLEKPLDGGVGFNKPKALFRAPRRP